MEGESALAAPPSPSQTSAGLSLEEAYRSIVGGYVRAKLAHGNFAGGLPAERDLTATASAANGDAADLSFPSLCDAVETFRNVRDGAPEFRPLLFTGASGTLTNGGIDYTIGAEVVFSLRDGQMAVFQYRGDGAGTTHTGASASAYSGAAFNVRNASAYPSILDLWSGHFGSASASIPVMPELPITVGNQVFSGLSANGQNNLDIIGASASVGFSAGVSWMGYPDWLLPSGGYADACYVPSNDVTQGLADFYRLGAANTVVQQSQAVCNVGARSYKYIQFSNARHPLIPQIVIDGVGQELPNTSMAIRTAAVHAATHAGAAAAPWLLAPTEAAILAMGIGKDFDSRVDEYYRTTCPKTTKRFCAAQTVGIAPDAKMILGAVGFPAEQVRDEARNYCLANHRTFFSDTRELDARAAYPSCVFDLVNPASWIEYAGIKGFVDARGGTGSLPNRAATKKVLAKLIAAAYLVKSGQVTTTTQAYQHIASRLLQKCGGTGCFFGDANNDTAYAVWVDGMGLLGLADGAIGSDGRRFFGVDAVLSKAGVAKLAIRASGVGPGSQDPVWGQPYFPDAADLKPAEWRYYVNFMGNKGFAQGTAQCGADATLP